MRHAPLPPSFTLHASLRLALLASLALALALGVALEQRRRAQFPVREAHYPLVGFGPLSLDPSALERAAAERQAKVAHLRGDPKVVTLLERVGQANAMQFAPVPAGGISKEARDLELQLTFAADEVLPLAGYEHFIGLGEPMLEACSAGLEALLEAVRRKEIDWERASSDPPPQFDAYRKNCGNALSLLHARAMVTPQGEWAYRSSPQIFRLLHRYRFGQLLHARRPAPQLIAAHEYDTLMRWRIEDPKAYGRLERQRYLMEHARAQPRYPAEFSGILMNLEGLSHEDAHARLDALQAANPALSVYGKLREHIRRSEPLFP